MRELAGPTFSITRLQVRDRGRRPDHPVGRAAASAQIADLPLEARGLQRPLGDKDQTIGLERLLDEIVGAELDRRHRRLDVAVSRNHHHRHVRMLALDRFEQLQAVELRALQPDVEEDRAADGALRSPRWPRPNCAPGARHVPRPPGCRRRVRGCRPRRRRLECQQPSGRTDPLRSRAAVALSSARRSGSFIKHFGAPAAIGTRRARREGRRSPPWSSNILTTMGRPSPVPSARVVT